MEQSQLSAGCLLPSVPVPSALLLPDGSVPFPEGARGLLLLQTIQSSGHCLSLHELQQETLLGFNRSWQGPLGHSGLDPDTPLPL